MGKIYLFEDEEKVGKITRAFLEEAGFEVEWFLSAEEGWETLNREEPDLLVLDLRFPGKLQGEEICKRLRQKESTLPIIMLTAYGEEEERVRGLQLGADDYLVKPFSLRELVARIQALLRRSGRAGAEQNLKFEVDGVRMEVDQKNQEAFINGAKIELTTTEFRVLAFLARHPGRPFSREELLEHIHGPAYDGFDRVIDAHIKNIRKKMNLGSGQFIQTIYGRGYRFSGGKER